MGWLRLDAVVALLLTAFVLNCPRLFPLIPPLCREQDPSARRLSPFIFRVVVWSISALQRTGGFQRLAQTFRPL